LDGVPEQLLRLACFAFGCVASESIIMRHCYALPRIAEAERLDIDLITDPCPAELTEVNLSKLLIR
jgi:hypothetical protein